MLLLLTSFNIQISPVLYNRGAIDQFNRLLNKIYSGY